MNSNNRSQLPQPTSGCILLDWLLLLRSLPLRLRRLLEGLRSRLARGAELLGASLLPLLPLPFAPWEPPPARDASMPTMR